MIPPDDLLSPDVEPHGMRLRLGRLIRGIDAGDYLSCAVVETETPLGRRELMEARRGYQQEMLNRIHGEARP